MRLAAALTGFALCFFVGYGAEMRMKKRSVLLRELCAMLKNFAVRMRYTAPTLRELLEGCGTGFAALVLENTKGADIRESWAAACDSFAGLEKEERRLLRELGSVLGTSSAEGQLSYIGQYLSALELLSSDADERSARLGKLYRTVGALSGAAVAVLMI